jgi:biotin carboxyl carrier protein
MLYFIRHGEKEYQVRVEFRAGRLHVQLENRPEEQADVVFQGNDVSLVRGTKVFFANVVGAKSGTDAKGDLTITGPGKTLGLQVESEYRRILQKLRGAEMADSNNVYAKMPGKIVKVLAKVGDRVESGAAVMVMEAMKMENEIRAPRAGFVANLAVTEGQAVEAGALLAEIAPDGTAE